ncbi:hypothetical protein D3Z52_18185 [Clostridiaceae bacterium]|nr:hypothetical protein [Clostridiaceae bacterium]
MVRNSVVLAVYLLFSVACFLTVHEHLCKGYSTASTAAMEAARDSTTVCIRASRSAVSGVPPLVIVSSSTSQYSSIRPPKSPQSFASAVCTSS